MILIALLLCGKTNEKTISIICARDRKFWRPSRNNQRNTVSKMAETQFGKLKKF